MRRAVAVAAVLIVCLSACTHDAAQTPTSTTSSPVPSGPATDETPTTRSDPPDGPPVLPEAAKAKTTAGAKAFVKFYAEVLNYSWQHAASAPLRKVSAAECQRCRDIADFIDRVTEAGGFQHGGEWVVLAIGVVPGQPDSRPTLLPLVRVNAGNWKRKDTGKLMKIQPHRVNLEFELSWDGKIWQVAGVDT